MIHLLGFWGATVTSAVTSTFTDGVPMTENGVGWRELSPRSALPCRPQAGPGGGSKGSGTRSLRSLGERTGGEEGLSLLCLFPSMFA